MRALYCRIRDREVAWGNRAVKDGIEKLRGEIASSTDAYDWWPEILFVSGLSGKRACICSNCGAVAPPNEAEDGYACPDCFWSCGKGQSWE